MSKKRDRDQKTTLTLIFRGPDQQAEMRAFYSVFRRAFDGDPDDDDARDALLVRACQAIMDLVDMDMGRERALVPSCTGGLDADAG